MLEEILVEAYGDAEQLEALRQAFEDEVSLPADAFVIGEPVLADLVMDGEPVEVVEHSASTRLTRWDRIACRILDLGDRKVLAGALLHFRNDAADNVIDAVMRRMKKVSRRVRKIPALKDTPTESIDALIRSEVMATTAPSGSPRRQTWVRRRHLAPPAMPAGRALVMPPRSEPQPIPP